MAMTTVRPHHRSDRTTMDDTIQNGRCGEMPAYFRWKHVPGRILAAALLIPAAPIVFLLVLIVRLGSRGPGIYRQERVGRGGRTFTMYKIRTMRHDAEAKTGPTWAAVHDPRLTRVGRFIRSVHLDELPQLINVLKGEMALVGPRPERPEFTQMLSREIDGYLDRLVVNPGVSGLAQINLPPDTDLDSVRRKLVLDLEYIRTASPVLDLRILCWTALRIVGLNPSRISRWLRLYRTVRLPSDGAVEMDEVRATDAFPASVGDVMANGAVIANRSPSTNGNGHPHHGVAVKRAVGGIKPR